MIRKFGVFGALLLLPACSSITEGTTQTLSFQSDPPGGECVLRRDGIVIGRATTPGAVLVHKTRSGIDLNCKLAGYEDVSAHIRSDLAAATFGNILLGGAVGVVIDMASGANNKYDPVTVVTFTPASGDAAAELRAANAKIAAAKLASTGAGSSASNMANPANWTQVEAALRKHFEDNRKQYGVYLEATSPWNMKLNRLQKLDERKSEKGEEQFYRVQLEVDGVRTGYTAAVPTVGTTARVFEFDVRNDNGTLKVTSWRMIQA